MHGKSSLLNISWCRMEEDSRAEEAYARTEVTEGMANGHNTGM